MTGRCYWVWGRWGQGRWVWGGAVLGAGAFLALGLAILDRTLPPDLRRFENASLALTARDGNLIAVRTTSDGYWRIRTAPKDVAPGYLDKLLAIEDKRFWHHAGVDPLAMARAVGQLVTHGHVVSGGSTLTMQTARLLMPHRHDVLGKLLDIARALQLEARYDKRTILSMYLTLAPFGGNIEGVRAASLAYFGHEPAQLSDDEAALLVALPQAPEHLRPDRHGAAAAKARDRILARLGLPKAVTPVPSRRLPMPDLAPHLADRLRLAGQRGNVTVTLDGRLQTRLVELVGRERQWLGDHANIAMLAVDNRSRGILAYVGGADYWGRAGMVDMVRARRSPGSTLKPFFYGMALDDALIRPDTLIDDTALRLGNYAPQDFDRSFHGTVTVRQALQQSYNLPAVKVLQGVGPTRFLAALHEAGANPVLPRGVDTPASLPIALGGLGISMADLAMLYTGLADEGKVAPLRLLAADPAPNPHAFLTAAAAWEIGDILRGSPTPDGVAPTRRRAIAYKTGTSYGFRDAWSAGYSPAYTVVVWVGRTEGTPRPGAYGRNTAAPLLYQVFDMLPPEPPGPPPAPPGAVRMASRAKLAPGLKRFAGRHPGLGGVTGQPPRIIFPPANATMEVVAADGQLSPVALEAAGGTPPYRWVINGVPVIQPPLGMTLNWQPDGPGFVHISLTDGRDHTVSEEIRLQ
ncbi:MAG TPA: penicillin-binding protein 1C [Stellaceae bacterium]|nr:penicillin-binding protein 1C [Stellaceae bacterium]